jgi:hypothetical protein
VRGCVAACLLASLAGCAQLLGIDELGQGTPDAGRPDAGSLPPTTPVPTDPPNGSRIQGYPTFSWETPLADDLSYVLEYGADPQLASGATRVETAERFHRPETPLAVSATPPVGARYYWRVTACVRTRCSAPSPIWYFDLGRLRPDVNGDGYEDLLVGAPLNEQGAAQAGVIRVYTGAPGSEPNVQADGEIVSLEAGEQLGRSLAIADFNGDGYADIVGGAPLHNGSQGRFHVYPGDATVPGVVFTPVTVPGAVPGTSFGAGLATGDFNGDGFADLAASAPGAGPNLDQIGQVSIYLGGPGEFSPAVHGIISGAQVSDGFASALDSAGDVNGDGYEDLVVGVPGARQAHIYFGSPDGLFDEQGALALSEPGTPGFGAAVGGAGDVDGDGYHDVLVGAPDADRVLLYRGGADELDAVADGEFTGAAGTRFGAAISSGGDMNGDGRPEVVIAALAEPGGGAIHVYRDASQELTVVNGVDVSDVGVVLSGPLDLNSDGLADMAMSGGPNIVLVVLGGNLQNVSGLEDGAGGSFGAALAP